MFLPSKIKYLAWDSDFFKLKAGSASIEEQIDLESLLNKARKDGFNLIYLFSKSCDFVSLPILEKYSGKLVDTKITYEYAFNKIQNKSINYHIIELKREKELIKLDELALLSGQYSRFRTDPKIEYQKFIEMYQIWVRSSMNGKMADKILTYMVDNNIAGFATLKFFDETGRIGLIAVDPSFQGRGIGKALIDHCIELLIGKGINKLEVSTQLENEQACRFYEKYGMYVKSKFYTYHLWL